VTFDLDGRVLYNDTISVENPPEICVDIPYLKEVASLCIRFYDLKFSKENLTGCVDLCAKIAILEVARIKLGCFNLLNGYEAYFF
jgi:hypothetical protein